MIMLLEENINDNDNDNDDDDGDTTKQKQEEKTIIMITTEYGHSQTNKIDAMCMVAFISLVSPGHRSSN
jgi:hypothetical protein